MTPRTHRPRRTVETTDRLDEIVARHGTTTLRELLELFEATIVDCVPPLRRAVAEGDAVALAQLAHRLGGACLSLGATRAGALCGDLQILGRSGVAAVPQDLLDELDGALERTRAAMVRRLAP
jgi:two-component system, sensor histidine kinase and response regulator